MSYQNHNYTHSKDNPNNYTLDYQTDPQPQMQNQNLDNSQHNYQNSDNYYQDRNQHSSQTLNTQQRRHYPRDEKQRKNEWEAMEQHKLEIINQLAKSEEEIKHYRQQEFLSELDKRVLAKLEEKRNLLQQQKEEAILMQQENEKFQQLTKQGKQDRKMLERLMGDYYSQQVGQKQSKEMEEKNQKLRWEQRLLDYNRQKLESEELRKRQQKEFMTYERLNDLERAKYNKNLQKQQDEKTLQEYREYMRRNEENQKNKDISYKNFYEITSLNQDKKQLEYFDKVGKQNLERQRQLDEIVNKNFLQEQIRRQQDEENRLLNQKRAYKQYDNGLYSLIPGYSLQIGQLPPKENRERMQQRYQQTIREQGISQAEQNWKQSYRQQLARENEFQAARQSMANLKQFQKIGEPLVKYNQSLVLEKKQEPIKSRVPENLIYGHNPITNPMPINVQNPYLAREFDKAQNIQRGRYFQQIGENLSQA
ncbi:hypothetical protein PPERSA_09985 [Pseudocohnilembus persalinus]|uniref:Uncharacterized protein n=1 Tax=Pseudocohnilembus persalinus TaxID=266149 RepID=A0A0V0QK21_PSEPJ|nr:hypothetical protein PPERSA_09985 [Pseudocohnilembus persalinus]|eukprot:KRX02368.1 hypothetical protein PPERSA_09985 [Pseudocohnilembus persalinus]